MFRPFVNINGIENLTSKINAGAILSVITDHSTIYVSIPNNAGLVNNPKMFNSAVSILVN